MSKLYRSIGKIVAEWDDEVPLIWEISELIKDETGRRDTYRFDLSPLLPAFESSFLYAVKEVWLDEVDRTSAATAHASFSTVKNLLLAVHEESEFEKFSVIDLSFLGLLKKAAGRLHDKALTDFRQLYWREAENNQIFSSELRLSHFPEKREEVPGRARLMGILRKVLTKETLVHVLAWAEAGFESGIVSLGRYALLKLAISIYCRPASYRKIILKDLQLDVNPDTGVINYFIETVPAKTRIERPDKDRELLPEDVGMILALQRADVVSKFGHLAPVRDGVRDVGLLPLFPAVRLTADRNAWVSKKANENYGLLKTDTFSSHYFNFFSDNASRSINATALRHTIGTSLAAMGCSTATIQAVLKHADDTSAKHYVDIAFEGLIDELSDSLVEGFAEHFPVIERFISKRDDISNATRIESDISESGDVEVTGECGQSVACHFAPLTCYGCHRFIPCYDADHSINLDRVKNEISRWSARGVAMAKEVEKWKRLADRIVVVIELCKARALSNDT